MPRSRWSTQPRDITITTDPDLVVSFPLLLDGQKVATVKLTATDKVTFHVDFLTEPPFTGLVHFTAWEHPA